jgi:hypothetical protein
VPAEPYITVTLKRDIVNKLSKVNPKKPTSALVAEAILEYISNKTYKVENKTPYIDSFKFDGTSTNSILNMKQ